MPERYEWPSRRPQQDPLADLRELWNRLSSSLPPPGEGRPRFKINPFVVLGVAVLLWLASGIYIVAPDQRGIVLRFGAAVRVTDPGPHYRLPWPIEAARRAPK